MAWKNATRLPLLLLLLLLLLPALARAEPVVFDLSCDNVSEMLIVRNRDKYWPALHSKSGYNGYYHILFLELEPAAAEKVVRMERTAPELCRPKGGGVRFCWEDMVFTANGKPLRNDQPEATGVYNTGISIIIVREHHAFEAARAICPDLVPDTVQDTVQDNE